MKDRPIFLRKSIAQVVVTGIRASAHIVGLFMIGATLWLCGCSSNNVSVSAASVTQPIVIATNSLPNGMVGAQYSVALSVTGGTLPYSWSITSGSLPAGLTLSSSGTISGMPQAPVASGSITFMVTDSGNPALSQSVVLALTVVGATPIQLAVTTTSLPSGQVGIAYSTTLASSGGLAPVTWSVTGGALPNGLMLHGTSGVISGTPTVAAAGSSITFMVMDSSSPALTQSATFALTIAPVPTLRITTTSLPNGQVGTVYSTALTYTGGTPPVTWSITSGTLPSGLFLNTATGAITGTPAATVSSTPITFQVQDAGSPAQTTSVNMTLTIVTNSGITVSVSPSRAGLTVTQTLSLTATTNDGAGVTWRVSPSGGSFNSTASLSGAPVILTAPSSAGTYTVTATSVSDSSMSSSITIGVTNLPGVYTYHNDLSRDGANAQEYALTTANVSTATFGKLFSCTVDGAIYAQPLWVANLIVGGAKHNVVFVATQHDSLYAFDADADTSPCVPLWSVSLIDTGHGGAIGETSVTSGPTGTPSRVGGGAGDITPEVGVTGTPVIDPSTTTVFVVSKSMNSAGTLFYQRLHAIDLTTGGEKPGSPVTIGATFPGTGDGGTIVAFDARMENQRPGLALVNGIVYIGWASHEDQPPYYGWMIGYSYNGSAFTQTGILNVTPNSHFGGIWMAGGAPAADSANNLYVLTGNGVFDPSSGEYGDSLLQLTSSLTVSQYFTPSDQAFDNANDQDFGSGGAAVLADLPAGSPATHLVIGGGKDGSIYVLNRDLLGGFGDLSALQRISYGFGVFATGAFWNSRYYIRGASSPLTSYLLNTTTAQFSLSAQSTTGNFVFPGSTPSISAMASSNGVAWDLDNTKYCTNGSSACGPTVLHAYDALNVATELWNSSRVTADAAGNAVKFTVPTVANGKVYVGTRGNNSGGAFGSTAVPGELDIFGLKPN